MAIKIEEALQKGPQKLDDVKEASPIKLGDLLDRADWSEETNSPGMKVDKALSMKADSMQVKSKESERASIAEQEIYVPPEEIELEVDDIQKHPPRILVDIDKHKAMHILKQLVPEDKIDQLCGEDEMPYMMEFLKNNLARLEKYYDIKRKIQASDNRERAKYALADQKP